MRLLILLVLFASPLAALDQASVDGDTLRITRYALLQDEIRKHFKLRIGEYESLDQAVLVRAKLGGEDQRNVIILREGTKVAAAIVGKADNALAVESWCFFEVDGAMTGEPVADAHAVAIRCEINDDGATERTRLLTVENNLLRHSFTFVSSHLREFDNARYVVKTHRRVRWHGGQLQLVATVEYLLDAEAIPEGKSTKVSNIVDGKAVVAESKPLSMTSHCAVARRLEREGLNRAALYHAREATNLAESKKLEESDPRRLEAISLVQNLEARLRRDEVVQK